MNHREIIDKLEANLGVFQALLVSVPGEQRPWAPVEGGWSLLEIVNHLADEEVADFRQRLEFALRAPEGGEREWQRIAPLQWVEARRYRQQDWAESCDRFFTERRASIRWLRELPSPNWKAKDDYPFGTQLTAEDSLANWLAHDFLHLRQINRLNWLYLDQALCSADLEYAGVW